MLEPEKERRLAELFQQALDLPEPEREQLVARARGEDAELGQRLAELLAEDARGTRGLLTGDALRPALDPQVRIGPYRLVRLLGEGGMGSVHLAEQDEPVQRTVALKTIRVGGGPEVLARFDAERQALARLAHPNVARIYDSGTTEAGLPWFAMEYCPGRRLDEHCDHARLGVSDRLRLLVPICDAVHHAHLRGVLHCDLKPANVIVTQGDGRSAPKVIDFGLARALAGTLSAQERAYEDRPVGTWRYISPEQADPRGDVDARADVWALGAMLYELLCGEPPFEGDSVSEVARRLASEEPQPPSRRLAGLPPERRLAVASARRSEPGALARRLRGDLDAIVKRALERNRTRRYSTPAELAADLQRYLDREPVSARPPRATYVLGKLVRRRPRLTALASLGLVATVALGAFGWIQVGRERVARLSEQRTRQDLEARYARTLREAMARRELWQIVLLEDPDLPLRELMRRAERVVAGLDRGDDMSEAALRWSLATVQLELGESEPARLQFTRAWELVSSSSQADDTERFIVLDSLIRATRAESRKVDPRRSRECVDLAIGVLAREREDLAQALRELFDDASSQDADELEVREELDDLAAELPGRLNRPEEVMMVTRVLVESAVALHRAGRPAESERLSRALEELAERTLDPGGIPWLYFLWRSAYVHLHAEPALPQRAFELATRLRDGCRRRGLDEEHWMVQAAEAMLQEARDAGADPGR